MSAPVIYQSISKIGAFAALDSTSVDYLALDPDACKGGGGPGLRTTVEPAPGDDGALIFAPLDDAWILTLVGDLVVTSNGMGSDGGYFDSVRTLYASLKSALDNMKVAADDLVHGGGTEKAWFYAPLDDTWTNARMCRVTFSVVVDVFA